LEFSKKLNELKGWNVFLIIMRTIALSLGFDEIDCDILMKKPENRLKGD